MRKFVPVFKEIIFNAGRSIFEILFGEGIEDFVPLPFEFPKIERKIADFVAKVKIGGHERILHFEFQTYNDPDIPFRMLRYKAELMRIYKLPVIQVLLYIGREKLNMHSSIYDKSELSEINFRFTIVDISNYEPEIFLRSDIPEAFILSLLCKIPEGSERIVMREIISRIRKKVLKEKIDYYILFVEIFSELRGMKEVFEEEVKEMGLDIDYRKSFLYRKGLEEGIERGIKEGIKEGIKKGIKEGKEAGMREGMREGLYEAISVALELKFGKRGLYLMSRVRRIEDILKLKYLKRELVKAKSLEEFKKVLDSVVRALGVSKDNDKKKR